MDAEIEQLIAHLERVNSEGFKWSTEDGFPAFVAVTGGACYFSSQAQLCLARIGRLIHSNRPATASRIEEHELIGKLRTVAAQAYAEGLLKRGGIAAIRACKRVMLELLEAKIKEAADPITHFFPAWTTGLERKGPVFLGPVRVLSVSDWLKTVEIYSGPDDDSIDPSWKQAVQGDAARPTDARTSLLLGAVEESLGTCNAVVAVTIEGFEQEFSRKLAHIAAKNCLDILSLLHETPDTFVTQGLMEDRLQPLDTRTLSEMDGFLNISGNTRLRPMLGGSRFGAVMERVSELSASISQVVGAVLTAPDVTHPQLCARWSMALHWFAEGCREPDDAVAVAKIGTSFDILSDGDKAAGIRRTVCCLLDLDSDAIVTKWPEPKTLRQWVDDIYEKGRSQILHGNHVDRLKSFAEMRQVAQQLCGITLRISLERLGSYDRADDSRAFQTMTGAPAA
ncbi:hypothetical protein [Stenotrophomonas sp. S39]|uniref:hypothetical protein n=1 Tax=Stenotrophomonas sp. S39 TaxID=2767451 RepID=UPI00190AA49C|nr:hypothetical protein [Stenotrophomonas sp. S39]MBK0052989.1 hypothetical protein [Stenotrophomonas sp. S39]